MEEIIPRVAPLAIGTRSTELLTGRPEANEMHEKGILSSMLLWAISCSSSA
jgi:hypothetical protein